MRLHILEIQAFGPYAAPHRIEWHWVKGNSGHAENERADALACAAANLQAKRSVE